VERGARGVAQRGLRREAKEHPVIPYAIALIGVLAAVGAVAGLWFFVLKPSGAIAVVPFEPCEHYDLETRTACPKPSTHELSETWLERDGGTGMTAFYCADHAPVGSVCRLHAAKVARPATK